MKITVARDTWTQRVVVDRVAGGGGGRGSGLLRQGCCGVAGWKHANDPLIPSRDIGHSLTRRP